MTLPIVPWRADNVWFRVVPTRGAFEHVGLQAWKRREFDGNPSERTNAWGLPGYGRRIIVCEIDF